MTNKEQFDKTKYILEFLEFDYISSVDARNQQPFGLNSKNGYFIHRTLLNDIHPKIPYKIYIKSFDWRFVIHKNKFQFAFNWNDLMNLIIHICEKYDLQIYEFFVGVNGYTQEEVFNNIIKEIDFLKLNKK